MSPSDINECDRNPCSQECANIYGSYQCYCREGYYLKEDGHTCEGEDILSIYKKKFNIYTVTVMHTFSTETSLTNNLF